MARLSDNITISQITAAYAACNMQAPAQYTNDNYAQEIVEKRRENRLNRLFSDGQTMPSPKRQGQANSLEDIGKYESERPVKDNWAHSALYDSTARRVFRLR